MKFLKLLPLILMLVGMPASVFAQNLNAQLQSAQNSKLLNRLRSSLPNDEDQSMEVGIPFAQTRRSQNTDDLTNGANVIARSDEVEAAEPSVIESYFKILTGVNLAIYGKNEFSQDQDTRLLFFNTFGSDYKLAPGDVIRINLRGFLEVNNSYKVTRDGKVILESLPPINVTGITTDDLELKLLELLRLGDASASAYVSLDTGRLVTVQISGGVKSPRTVAVPAYTPLSRILAYVGGVSNVGSLRNINVFSNTGQAKKVDFYDFLQNPLGGVDPVIVDSSRVFIGDLGTTVAVSGFVSRAGIYELASGENKIAVKDLMKLSASNLLPPGAVIEVLFFDEDGSVGSRPITLDEEINAGEALNVRFVNTRNTNVISVRGAVIQPYDLSASEPVTLAKILKGGAVLSREAEIGLSVIYGPKIQPYVIDINQELNKGKFLEETGSLSSMKPNSTIYILNKEEYRNLIASGGKQLKPVPNNQAVEPVQQEERLPPTEILAQRQIDGVIPINVETKIDLDQEAARNNFLIAKKVSIYLDGKLNVVLAPNSLAIGESKLISLATGFEVYPLYIGFNRYDEKARTWSYLQLKAADLFSKKFNVVFKKNDQLNFYSTEFINQLGSEIASVSNLLELDQTVNIANSTSETAIKNAFSATDQGVNALLKSARDVFGAVDRPGAYPIAGTATLAELLSVAGGTVDGADLSEIKIINYKSENGRLLAGTDFKVNILNEDPMSVSLAGKYTVMVPFLINDASSGTISLSGEVLQPGDYIFSRSETLQEVIEKAGGLSKTAYPLGVVLSREAVREKQREANKLLASDVEASILQLSQSDVAGAKDQVKAILGFAERLRNQEVVGRLTVNVLVSDPSAPIFLEDGDEVFVPKRPSYVSVIGSVQKETMASYSAKKSFPDYIAAAGGLNSGADKRSIYVLLPNGESVRASQDVVIPPGAVVVVPPKTDKLSILGFTDIISRVMGNIATSVLAINNVN